MQVDPKERPGASKGRAKQVILVPRKLPRSLRDAQDGPKGAQGNPRMNQREPKGSRKGAQDDTRGPGRTPDHLKMQKDYVNRFYNWNVKSISWTRFLEGAINAK